MAHEGGSEGGEQAAGQQQRPASSSRRRRWGGVALGCASAPVSLFPRPRAPKSRSCSGHSLPTNLHVRRQQLVLLPDFNHSVVHAPRPATLCPCRLFIIHRAPRECGGWDESSSVCEASVW